jgi:hypothetical protein
MRIRVYLEVQMINHLLDVATATIYNGNLTDFDDEQ